MRDAVYTVGFWAALFIFVGLGFFACLVLTKNRIWGIPGGACVAIGILLAVITRFQDDA